MQKYDLLIVNGHILDGSGSPWFEGSVAVKDGKIADVGRLKNHIAANSMFAWNYADDFFAGHDHGKQAGTMSVADHGSRWGSSQLRNVGFGRGSRKITLETR